MGEAISEPAPKRPALSQILATVVMSLCGCVAAGMVIALNARDVSEPLAALAIMAPCGALSAALAAWPLMGWAVTHTSFRWVLALIIGMLTGLLSYLPFGVLLAVWVILMETLEGGLTPDALRVGASFTVFSILLGPPMTGHIVLPLGGAGGLICYALSRRKRSGVQDGGGDLS